MELKCPIDVPARGRVIEAHMDSKVGSIASVLIQEGLLKVGDTVVCGSSWGKIRKMLSDNGESISQAEPSWPVQVRKFLHAV